MRLATTAPKTSSRDDILLAVLSAIGFLAPTSIGGEYSQALLAVSLVVLLVAIVILYWKYGCRASILVGVSLPLMITLSAFTFFAASDRFGWGVFAEFNLLALVYALDLKKMQPGPWLRRIFKAANVTYIMWGVGIVLGIDPVLEFTFNWYSQFYQDLVPTMLWLHKPVISFGTHSLAGFFSFVLFTLNWGEYAKSKSRLALTFCICYVGLLIALSSFTSLLFASVALIQLITWFWTRNRRALLVGLFVMAGIALLIVSAVADQIDQIQAANPKMMEALLNGDISGPSARYGGQGDLAKSITYLKEHPFSPVGYTNPSFLFFADSGPIEYLLRGSIPALCLIYIGLYYFLRDNGVSHRYAIILFATFAAFELGFVALTYIRTLLLLPLVVIYPKTVTDANG